MMRAGFEYTTNLQYKVKHLSDELESFKSGEKYTKLEKDHKDQRAFYERKLKAKDNEIAQLHKQLKENRKNDQQVMEDLEAEKQTIVAMYEKKLAKVENEKWKLAQEKDTLKDKVKELRTLRYTIESELEEEKGKNQTLIAEKNRDSTNSSNPSSKNDSDKPVQNNRPETDRKPGGQKGSKGNRRKQYEPTHVIILPEPEEFAQSENYNKTGRIIKKQQVDIEVSLVISEYQATEYRNKKTGQRVHAQFPNGLVNEVTYNSNIKAMAFLLNNRCNISIDKTRDFLSEITSNELKLSKGLISGLCKEFSKKSQKEQTEAFNNLQAGPVQHVDFTNSRVNGKNMQVFVCANDNYTLYLAREKKGHEGVKGSPAEIYYGILIHDHDKTFYHYGKLHQECLSHVLRYLKDSMENEPNLNWSTQMHELLQAMIHYQKGIDPEDPVDEEKVKWFENIYDAILELAKQEYEYEPPTSYYREGFNLSKKLREYKEAHLLFLHMPQVPYDNNLCEREARNFKRKQKQMMTFRSFENFDYFCNSLSVMNNFRNQKRNLYDSVSEIFDRIIKKPQKA